MISVCRKFHSIWAICGLAGPEYRDVGDEIYFIFIVFHQPISKNVALFVTVK